MEVRGFVRTLSADFLYTIRLGTRRLFRDNKNIANNTSDLNMTIAKKRNEYRHCKKMRLNILLVF